MDEGPVDEGPVDEQGNQHVEALDLEPTAAVRSRPSGALWGALAVVAVAVGAVVVTSTNDNGQQQPGLPVDLAGAARGVDAAADASMVAWVEYIAGDDLPALGGEATAYRLRGDVDEAGVRALADALGLDGDVESDGEQSWWIDGGAAGRLDVYSGAGASWSFYAGGGDCVVDDDGFESCGNAVTCAEGPGVPTECESSGSGAAGVTTPGMGLCEAEQLDCVDPTTTTYVGGDCGGEMLAEGTCPDDTGAPDTGSDCQDDDCVARCEETGECAVDPSADPSADLPSEDDAHAAALAIVTASGADVEGARVAAEPGFGSWFVTVEPEVDGLPSGLLGYVEIGSELRVISGNGFFGQPEALGEYPLVDTFTAIERANEQSASYSGVQPALGDPEAMSSTTGGTDDIEDSVSGNAGSGDPGVATDPCGMPEGVSDGCGGSTDLCGDDGCVEPSTTIPCKVQADGREICEYVFCETGTAIGGTSDDATTTTTTYVDPCRSDPCLDPAANPVDCPMECPQLAPDVALPAEREENASDSGDEPVSSEDEPVAAPERCAPPIDPGVDPVPEGPLQIVLTDAEHSLVLLPANDGSGDAYLIPAYRFSAKDSGTVDLPAIADEALTGPATPDTTVPDTVQPGPDPVPEPRPCEVLEEQDPESETTLTVQTCNPDDDTLVIGEGYYVDIDTQCAGGTFELGGIVWMAMDDSVEGWADPGERHEGGTFTLDSADHGTFVGDAEGTKTAEFITTHGVDLTCTPQPR